MLNLNFLEAAATAAEGSDRMENFMKSLSIMGSGMLGIFVTVIIVMLVVFILSPKSKKKNA